MFLESLDKGVQSAKKICSQMLAGNNSLGQEVSAALEALQVQLITHQVRDAFMSP